MYLMVMYFLTGSHRDVFKMVESCVSEELTSEEQQIFNQLEFLGNDSHPDAHACRLKLSAVTVGLGEDAMECPWSVEEEMRDYVRKHFYVSAECRLSTDEELLLLQQCSMSMDSELYVELMNRRAFVSAIESLENLPKDRTLTVKLGTSNLPTVENFDRDPDTTILSNPKETKISSKVFSAAYSRPEDQVIFGGLRGLQFINGALMSGITLSSSHYGFPLLYDLLVGTIPFKVHPSDRTHNWGRMLFRLIPPSDYCVTSAEMSALRILSENPNIACHPNIPKFQIDSTMSKFKGMFKGSDAVSRVVEQLHAFLTKTQIRSMIEFPPMFKESVTNNNTIKLKAPSSLAENRSWVIPRISNYSQNTFDLDIQNCAGVNIPVAQLQAFASRPLAPIKLESFVQYIDRSQRRLPPASAAVPFNISGDKATKTHCSEATMRRITSDVSYYAQKTNAESEPTLIGFSPADVDSFHHSPSALNKAQSQLASLSKSLNTSMRFDRQSRKYNHHIVDF